MGLFDFLGRRRQRESAIPGSSESITRQLKGDGEPIGQPVQGVGQQGFDLGALPTDLSGMVSMFQQGLGGANVQVTQGESQVIDARGTAGLRDEILNAMREHGIDPDDPANSQVNAADMPGLQAQIMQALQNAGIDAGQLGAGGITIEQSGDDPAE